MEERAREPLCFAALSLPNFLRSSAANNGKQAVDEAGLFTIPSYQPLQFLGPMLHLQLRIVILMSRSLVRSLREHSRAAGSDGEPGGLAPALRAR